MNLRPLLIAIGFLTRLPVPAVTPRDEQESGSALIAYPVVGALLGALLALLAAATAALPALLQAALIVAAWVALTGALHLDGLADAADAWVGGLGDREQTLAIMKDTTCGPMAVTAIAVVLLLKLGAVAALVETAWLAIPAAVVAGRAGLTALLLTTPYVRRGGIGEALSRHAPRGPSLLSAAALTAAAALLAGWSGVAAIAAAAAALALAQHAMIRRIGGTTGDTAGAAVELTETAALIGAAAAAALA